MSERILDRYQPLFEAGSGGFASVVVAYDMRIRREVAIKCIPLDDAQTQALSVVGEQGESAAGLSVSIMNGGSALSATTPGLEEARTAAMLNDPSIVSIYDFEVQGSMAYLIMEYVEGMSVADLLSRYPDEMNPDIVAAVFRAVAHALQVAHANHVLHLDIKPDNVLIDQRGQVKVVDFGLARLAGEGGFGTAVGGTIGYMPVEQMRREELDERCDEWALASLTYELLSGKNPFVENDLDAAEDAIFDAELVLPSLCMEGLDDEIDDILFCALSPYRDERYDSVKEFAKNLQPCLGDAKQGTKDLTLLVGHFAQEEEPQEGEDVLQREPRIPFDPFTDRLMAVWVRLLAALNVGLLGFVSLSNLPFVQGWADPACWGTMIALVVAAALLPHVGTLAGMIAMGVMLFMNEAPLPAVALIAVACAWWASFGRSSHRSACVVGAPAALGAISCAPLVPFLAGWLLRPLQAGIAAACAGVVAFSLGGMGTLSILGWDPMSYSHLRIWDNLPENFALFVQDPAQWICFASWVLAAVAFSAMCEWARGRKPIVYGGIGVALAILVVGLCVGSFAERAGSAVSPDPLFVVSTVASFVIMCVLAVKGCPPREYEPDEQPPLFRVL